MTQNYARPGIARKAREGELGIVYACFNWLPKHGYPHVFQEVAIPRGIGRGKVDVAAANWDFTRACTIEVKVHYRGGDAEGQLYDARKAAHEVWLAAPPDVTARVHLDPSTGLLHPRPWPPRGTAGLRLQLDEARQARRLTPNRDNRKFLLHALMRQALRRGRTPEGISKIRSCPACERLDCEHWNALRGPLLLDESDVRELLGKPNPFTPLLPRSEEWL